MAALCLAAACVAWGCAASEHHDPRFDRNYDAAQDKEAFAAAMALVAEHRYDDAAERLSLLAAAPEAARDPDRSPKVLFWLGYCHEKQGRPAEAADFYRKVVQEYPDTPAAAQASERLSLLAATDAP